MRLGDVVNASSERNKGGRCGAVYSVTNSQGFIPSEDYFSKEVYSKNLKTYRVVKRNMIAYNPSRINVGSVALQDKCDEVVVSPLYVVFSVDENRAMADYVVRFLKSKPGLDQIAFQSIGTVRNNLKFKALCQMKLILPSFAVQEERLANLASIESQINQSRKTIKELDQLVKSRFVEMLGVEKREKVLLGELVHEMHIGPFGSAMKNEVFVPQEQADCVVYEQKHAIRQSIDLGWRYVDARKRDELKRFEAGPGTILVSCRGTLGKIYQLPDNAPVGIIHPSLMKIAIDEARVNGTFFTYLLEDLFTNAEAQAEGSGVKMAIKAKELAATEVACPSIAVQERFADFARQVDKSRFVACFGWGVG